MNVVHGDLLSLMEDGTFDVMIHGCNCFNTMGGGIAGQISKRWPMVSAVDILTESGDINKLGQIQIVPQRRNDGTDFYVVNAYTQYEYGTDKMNVDYEAIVMAFRKVAKSFLPGTQIAYPRIGCGLAGGDWDVVKEIIANELNGHVHTLVEYAPGK